MWGQDSVKAEKTLLLELPGLGPQQPSLAHDEEACPPLDQELTGNQRRPPPSALPAPADAGGGVAPPLPGSTLGNHVQLVGNPLTEISATPPNNKKDPIVRRRFDKVDLAILEREFVKHKKPNDQTLQAIADLLANNDSVQRIKTWFARRRTKHKEERKHRTLEKQLANRLEAAAAVAEGEEDVAPGEAAVIMGKVAPSPSLTVDRDHVNQKTIKKTRVVRNAHASRKAPTTGKPRGRPRKNPGVEVQSYHPEQQQENNFQVHPLASLSGMVTVAPLPFANFLAIGLGSPELVPKLD